MLAAVMERRCAKRMCSRYHTAKKVRGEEGGGGCDDVPSVCSTDSLSASIAAKYVEQSLSTAV